MVATLPVLRRVVSPSFHGCRPRRSRRDPGFVRTARLAAGPGMTSPAGVSAAAPLGERAPAGRYRTGLISLLASAVLLAVLYRSMDLRLIGDALLRAGPLWLLLSVAAILPITVLRAARFLWVAPPGALPGLGEALRLT